MAQVIEAGYTLNDRLLRPAKVGVTKGGPKPEPVAAAAEEAAPAATEGKDGSKAYEKDAGGAGGRVDEKL